MCLTILAVGSGQFSGRYIGQVVIFCFFFAFFHALHFITYFVSDISVNYQYIDDISPILADIFRYFPSNDFRLLVSCREGPIPKIWTIH